jgi:predicted transposase/invertase (TIGR01784 family)
MTKEKKEKKPVRRIGHFLDPKMDFVFKQIFGKDKEIFAGFVNSVLMPPENKRVVDVTFLDKDLTQKYERDKESRLDVLAQLKDGSQINVEIQIKLQDFFEARILYYWSRIYTNQIKESEPYTVLRPVVCICLLDWICYPEYKDLHTVHRVMNSVTGEQEFKEFEIHFVEIPKFDEEVRSELSDWLHFLLAPVDDFKNPLIKKAKRNLDVMSHDEVAREIYEARLKEFRDQYGQMQTAERIGLEKGLEKGREEGRKEEQRAMVKKMLAAGMSFDGVAALTGLSEGEVKSIGKSSQAR